MQTFPNDDVDFSGIDDIDDIAQGYFNPDVNDELDAMAGEMVMLGYADDDELMGSVIKNLINRIKSRIQERRSKGIDSSISLPGGGSVNLSVPGTNPNLPSTKTDESGIMATLKKPVVLASVGGGIGLIVLLMVLKKRKKGRK